MPKPIKWDDYSLDELRAIRRELDGIVVEREEDEREKAFEEIQQIAIRVGLTPEELVALKQPKRGRPKGGPKTKAKPKYRHPDTGAEWSGRGMPPAWLREAEEQGQNREEFAIAE
ncbi:MAG: H-NS histone family protein [Gammaproteobacteria bacterium]